MSPPDHTPQPDERFEYLIEHLQDAVVQFDLVDGDPIVRAVNPAFTSVFGYDDGDIVGEPLNEFIVPSWLAGEADALDDRTAAGEVNYRRVRRQTAEGLKLFLYRGIPYRDADGGHAGFAVYTDLTERSRRERRLEVVGRVLRHNLRNRVTVLAGAAGQIRDGLEDPPPEVARALDRVDDVAGTLGSVADEAADIHALLEAPPDEAPVVDSFSVSEAGSPNPHAKITADWVVSDVDGDLDSVVVEVLDGGSVVDSATTQVSGGSASGTDVFEIKHGGGTTYDVELTVTDESGLTATETRTVTAP